MRIKQLSSKGPLIFGCRGSSTYEFVIIDHHVLSTVMYTELVTLFLRSEIWEKFQLMQ